MILPNVEDIKAKISHEVQDVDQVQRLKNLKSSVLQAYREVKLNNRKSHQKNKVYYDKKAKKREFEVNDRVYLFCPAKKPGRCHKFRSFWQGPFVVVQKLSELNFKIVNKKGKEFVVHINQLKKSYDSAPWKFETVRHPRQRARKPDAEPLDETVQIQSRPIATEKEPEPRVAEEGQIQVGQKPKSPEMVEPPAEEGNRRQVPDSSVRDPDYVPPHSPHSRRKLARTPIAPPITRSRARLQMQDNPPE
jgi:hypothetical protein